MEKKKRSTLPTPSPSLSQKLQQKALHSSQPKWNFLLLFLHLSSHPTHTSPGFVHARSKEGTSKVCKTNTHTHSLTLSLCSIIYIYFTQYIYMDISHHSIYLHIWNNSILSSEYIYIYMIAPFIYINRPLSLRLLKPAKIMLWQAFL